MTDVRQAGPVIEATAGEAVTAFLAGIIIDGEAVVADNTNAAHVSGARGIFRATKAEGETCQLHILGPVRNSSWNWTSGPVYLGAAGALTQTKPTSGIVQQIGWADTATILFVNPGEPKAQAERHVHKQEQFTLNGTDVSNKYVLLALEPVTAIDVQLFVEGAPPLRYSADFQMDGANPKKLTWSALGLDGLLAAGDKLTVHYFRAP